jgi:peptidoglycan/LPS O-acetylase OafA/YrhL
LGYFLAEAYFSYGHVINKLKFINIISMLSLIEIIIIVTFSKALTNDISVSSDRHTALLAFIFVAAATFSPLSKKLFSYSISRFLGRISFPIYLIHMPVISSLSSYLLLYLSSLGYEHQTVANIIVAATIIFSICFAWTILFVESLSVNLSKRLAKKLDCSLKVLAQQVAQIKLGSKSND